MAHDMNNITDVRSQPPERFSKRIFLNSGDVIKGLVGPGGTDPAGQMIKGPFDNNPWTIKLREIAGEDADVRMVATYDLDVVREFIQTSTPVSPNISFTDASPTWEPVALRGLVAYGNDAFVVDWATAGLSEARAPSAVRFYFFTDGKSVKIEIEEGTL